MRCPPCKVISSFSLEARNAGPRPKSIAVATATPVVKPTTTKSGWRLNAIGSGDVGSRETSTRVPQTDRSTPTKAPKSDRVKFSVNSCHAMHLVRARQQRACGRQPRTWPEPGLGRLHHVAGQGGAAN